jgi:hypothetical protein
MSEAHDPFPFDVEYGDPAFVRSARDPQRPPETGPEWEPNGRASDIPIEPGGDPSPFADLNGAPPEEFPDITDMLPEDEPYPNSDIDSRKIAVTFFEDEFASTLRRVDLTLPQLAEHIRFQTAASKMALPWLKLAIFGNQRSEKNCLRTNENVMQISGLEGDHDSGQLAFDDARAFMLMARIRCILYTSASHVPGTKERWRILVPLSKNYPPEWREKGVARINGLLGGHLAGESFTLSLSYLYGHLKGAEYRVEVIDGDFLNLRDDTYAGSIFKDGSRVGGNGNSNGAGHDFNSAGPQSRSRKDDDPGPVDINKIEAALNVISSDCSYRVWLKVGGALHHALGKAGFDLFDRWSAKAVNKYNADECKEKWRGIRSLTEHTEATIYFLADEADSTWQQRYADEEARRAFERMAAAAAGAPNGSTGNSGTAGTASAGLGIPLDFYEDFDKAVPKKWIIKGVIAKGETSSWVGPPGSGKSALLTNLVSHATEGIATATAAREWRGYRLKERAGVVYFALERGQLVKRRLIAANGPPKLPIAVASHVINLLDPACVPVIVETIRTAEAHFGCPVGMIVVDTFNKGIAAGGGDEDKAKDQNTTFANLRRVHELVPVHIALIGHTGKDESRGARGSSAHPGDVDMMVQISVSGDTRTAIITKINDGMEGVLTRFKLRPVILGQDEDGDPITTAIVSDDAVDAGTPQAAGAAKERWPKSLRIFKAAVETAIIDHGKPMRPYGNEGPLVRAVRLIDVRNEFLKAYPAEGDLKEDVHNAKRKAFSRALKQGRDKGLIGSREIGGVDFLWTTAAG